MDQFASQLESSHRTLLKVVLHQKHPDKCNPIKVNHIDLDFPLIQLMCRVSYLPQDESIQFCAASLILAYSQCHHHSKRSLLTNVGYTRSR